jgi:hypothetical protein
VAELDLELAQGFFIVLALHFFVLRFARAHRHNIPFWTAEIGGFY